MRTALIALAVWAASSLLAPWAHAQDAEDQASRLTAIDESLAKAGEFLRAKKPAEAAASLAEAQEAYQTLAAGEVAGELRPRVERLAGRLEAAERLIAKAQGTTAKPAAPAGKKPVAEPATKNAPPAKPTAKAKKPAKPRRPVKAPAGPSFTSDVAPILIARCGNCHVRNNRGGLSMATFAALEKGSAEGGPIVRAMASQGSRIVEVIVSGDMPRGGGRVTPEELNTIAAWIDAGALFDGTDRTAPLGQKSMAPEMPEGVVKATGSESVHFNRDLAPLLVANCVGCHGGDTPGGQLRMETFADFLKGGSSGVVFEAGKPGESLIVKRLRGIDGDRMPQDKDALSEEAIAKFETWIKEGGTYDGVDPSQPLKIVVEVLAAGRLSHEELTAKRMAQAQKIWGLAVPDEQSEQMQTAHFILRGNVSQVRLNEVAELAEAERAKIAKLLKLDPQAPLVKGGLVLFVLKRSFDYSEFVQMVEQREAPRGVMGHARTKGSDAYACIAAPPEADANLPALVAEQIAAGYLQSLGEIPPWFTAGAARAIAARVEPKNPLVKQWNAELQRPTSGGGGAGDAFLSSAVFDGETAAQSYSFANYLMSTGPRFQALIAALSEGRAFGQALEDAYRANARALVELWLRRKPGSRG